MGRGFLQRCQMKTLISALQHIDDNGMNFIFAEKKNRVSLSLSLHFKLNGTAHATHIYTIFGLFEWLAMCVRMI